MADLLKTLAHLTPPAWGSVIYVGAGDGLDTTGLSASPAPALTLIEAEPTLAAALERRTAHLPHVRVVVQALAPADGVLPWRRWSLPELNGPVDWAPLAPYYPRLQPNESVVVPARAMSTVLNEMAGVRDARGANALIIDLPGQEAALLSAVPAETLMRFDLVVLRRCAALLRATPEADAVPALLQAGFEQVEDDRDTEPLWPTVVLRFDLRRHAQREAEARQRELEAQRAMAEQEAAMLRAQVAALSSDLAAAADRADSAELAASACHAARQAVEARCDELQAAGLAANTRLQAVDEELQAARERADEVTERLRVTEAALATAEAAAGTREQQLAELKIDLAAAADRADSAELAASACHAARQAVEARCEELQAAGLAANTRLQAVDEELQAARERADQVTERLRVTEAALATAEAAAGTREQQLAELRAGLDTASATISCQALECDKLREQVRLLEKRLAEWATQAEALAADAQREREGRAQADKARESVERLLAQTTAQVETLWQEKHELQDSIGHQLSELEALRSRLQAASEQATITRRSLESQVAEWRARAADPDLAQRAQSDLSAERQARCELERQLEDLRSQLQRQELRQQMLRDELNKAEGQVEIVKSLLLADLGL